MRLQNRLVVGKRITDVRTTPILNNHGGTDKHVEAIVLEDGSEIRFCVSETESLDYTVYALYVPAQPRSPQRT